MLKSKSFLRKKTYGFTLLLSMLFLFSVLLLFSGCTSKVTSYKHLYDFHSGDAKWIDAHAILGSDNHFLCIYDCTSNQKHISDVPSQWCYYYPEEQLVIYSNWDYETGICKLSEDYTLEDNHIIFKENENLRIDPTLNKMGDTYYITSTAISGTVNRLDPNAENGIYALELYRSKDLVNWEKVSTISRCAQNTEDIDLMVEGNILRVNYEKESIDRGPSQIITRTSSDGGVTWSEEIILVDNGGDNEMAALIPENDKYYLFYSSDIACPGESYTGASLYLNIYDTTLNLLSTDLLETKPEKNIRVYDVIKYSETAKILFAYDYLGKNDLITETVMLP